MTYVPAEIIRQKRDGQELTGDQLNFMINGYLEGRVPEHQMAALLMATYFQSMTDNEAATLTEIMLNSGQTIDFSHLPGLKVDKHSTGGVGDKTSMILAPLVAASGLHVPMIAGRSLGHTGGTLDKLESIPGFRTQLTRQQFSHQVEKIGFAMAGQTEDICPADKRLYALRDVTGTIESLPLICGSIMSKKIAEGIDALVLDVKYGSGAFMKTVEQAEELSHRLAAIGRWHGKSVAAVLSNMDQPLGRFIGNALEIEECLAIMTGEALYETPVEEFSDTTDITLELAGHMIWLGGLVDSAATGVEKARQLLDSGAAYENFRRLCQAQGGRLDQLPRAPHQDVIEALQDGHLYAYHTEDIGMASLIMGAGRQQTTDLIDPVAGLQLHKKIGDPVTRGEPLFTLYASTKSVFPAARERLLKATEISLQKPSRPALIHKRIVTTDT